VPATTVANLNLTVAPGTEASSTTAFSTTYNTSATGGLTQAAGSAFIYTFPSGTGLTQATATAFDNTPGKLVANWNCCSSNTNVAAFGLLGGAVVNPGDNLTVVINAVHNPATAGNYTVQVSTTSD